MGDAWLARNLFELAWRKYGAQVDVTCRRGRNQVDPCVNFGGELYVSFRGECPVRLRGERQQIAYYAHVCETEVVVIVREICDVDIMDCGFHMDSIVSAPQPVCTESHLSPVTHWTKSFKILSERNIIIERDTKDVFSVCVNGNCPSHGQPKYPDDEQERTDLSSFCPLESSLRFFCRGLLPTQVCFVLKYSPNTALTVSGTDSSLQALRPVLHASGVS